MCPPGSRHPTRQARHVGFNVPAARRRAWDPSPGRAVDFARPDVAPGSMLDTSLESVAFGGPRRISVYRPAGVPADGRILLP
jgi:hypothetical protein